MCVYVCLCMSSCFCVSVFVCFHFVRREFTSGLLEELLCWLPKAYKAKVSIRSGRAVKTADSLDLLEPE